MSSERVPTPASVWEFHPTDDMTDDDLIQVTYKNGNSIFLMKGEDCWVVDSSLMSHDLQRILAKYHGKEFRLQRKTLNDTLSGHVGHPLTFRISSDIEIYGRDILCTSMFNVEAITAVPRAQVDEDPLSYRSVTHIDWPA